MLFQDDAKTNPELRKVFRKLADGTDITWADYLDAEIEFQAYCQFHGFKLDMWENFMVATHPVPTEVILQGCRPTGMPALNFCAVRIADEAAEARRLPRLVSGMETFTAMEQWEIQQGLISDLELRKRRFESSTLTGLGYIANRAEGWTMLGVKNAESLRRIVKLCFGEASAQLMTSTGGLSTRHVLLLIARNNSRRMKAPAKANSISKEEKSAAAKKGWNRRKQGGNAVKQ